MEKSTPVTRRNRHSYNGKEAICMTKKQQNLFAMGAFIIGIIYGFFVNRIVNANK
jgi:hypothetical protein